MDLPAACRLNVECYMAVGGLDEGMQAFYRMLCCCPIMPAAHNMAGDLCVLLL